MKTGNRFERGSGVYKCGSCGRGTRSTGHGDNEHLRLCVQCFELAGMDNELTDTGTVNVGAVQSYFAELAEKGIDAPSLFPELASYISQTTGVSDMKTDTTLANAFRVKKNADRAAGKKPPVAKIKAKVKQQIADDVLGIQAGLAAIATAGTAPAVVDVTKLTPAQRVAKIQADAEAEAAAKAAKPPISTANSKVVMAGPAKVVSPTLVAKAAAKKERLAEQDKVLASPKPTLKALEKTLATSKQKIDKANKVAKVSDKLTRRNLRRALRKAARTAAADALKGVTAVGMDLEKLAALSARAAVAAVRALQDAVTANAKTSGTSKASPKATA
jgi:hypothetical protein